MEPGFGLYIHIPFCERKCSYCSFFSIPRCLYRDGDVDSFVRYLEKEMRLILQGRPAYSTKVPYGLSPEQGSLSLPCSGGEKVPVRSVFIGGGTPTCLTAQGLEMLLTAVGQHFSIKPGTEFSIEANPATLSIEKVEVLSQHGVNRVSLGVQSLDQELLGVLGRLHGVDEVYRALEMLRTGGFRAVNLDLIFAVPGQDRLTWKDTLTEAIELRPEHLSCYSLEIEEATPLGRQIMAGEVIPVSEEDDLWMYQWCRDVLHSAGFHHYEISNFALPGYECRHNLLYWRCQPYIGIGPAAHSFYGGRRWANVSDVDEYIADIDRGWLPREWSEHIGLQQQMDETMFMGLRLMQGVDAGAFTDRFGLTPHRVYEKELEDLDALGLIEVTDEYIRLSERGLPVANRVFMRFIR